MVRRGFRVLANVRQWSRIIDILIVRHDPTEDAATLVYEFIEDRTRDVNSYHWKPGDRSPIDASLSLDENDAQELMDQLWRCGLRPTEAAGSAGALQATERHLEDMRKLTFTLMERDERTAPATCNDERGA